MAILALIEAESKQSAKNPREVGKQQESMGRVETLFAQVKGQIGMFRHVRETAPKGLMIPRSQVRVLPAPPV